MTGWEVADTAVKIGLGSAITAIATIVAVWVSRSTELKKDRRQRRQDALEKISEDFESAHAATCLVIAAFVHLTRQLPENSPKGELSRVKLEEFERRLSAFTEAKGKLSRVEGWSHMIRIKQATSEVEEYMEIVGRVNEVLDFRELAKGKEVYDELIGELTGQAAKIRASFGDAFDAI